jgi:hypothetical protein
MLIFKSVQISKMKILLEVNLNLENSSLIRQVKIY